MIAGPSVFSMAANLYPATTNTYALGATGNCWSTVYTTNGTVSTSDNTAKDSVPLPYGLSDILNVDTIKYKWKSQAALPDDDPEKSYEYYGVCADQLDPLFPELIYNRQRPFQINYQELIPVCINALKDLNAQNVALGTKVDALSSRLSAANIA